MSLEDELIQKVRDIFSQQWSQRDGQVVPSSETVKLSNDTVILTGTILYADMSESTKLVDTKNPLFAAEIYKTFLHCAAKIIRSEGGIITAYDGDRIMAVFLGNYKNTSATRAALKLNYARVKIINPEIRRQYTKSTYYVNYTIGIDTSVLHIANTGIRGSNDLVWVGKSANHAAKLCGLPNTHQTRITSVVYNKLPNNLKYSNNKSMWEKRNWTDTGRTIYRSNWRWGSP